MAYIDDSRDIAAIADEARVADYVALLKPRVMSLVVFTALVGMLLAPGGINPVVGLVAILCIAVGAGASGALNMWFDADIDRVMSRTANRPIPAGRVPRVHALSLGLWLSAFSVALLGLATNWLAAGLLAFTIFFYAVIYTMWLKRLTPQNIVIGGAAGAFPPMIGWAAVTGGVDLHSLLLFTLIFVWTPPHFWALALYRQIDYAKARVPMLPVVAGRAATKRQILAYSLVLAPLGVMPALLGTAGAVYGAVAAVMGLCFVLLALAVSRSADDGKGDRPARQLFGYSILYLFVIFTLLIVDRAPGLLRGADLFGLVG